MLAGLIVVSYYNKPHMDYASQKAVKSWSAEELLAWFTSHAHEDHSQWLGSVVSVAGTVTFSDEQGCIFAPGVVATWETGYSPEQTLVGAHLTVKGRLVGFDDLFNEVRLDHARPSH